MFATILRLKITQEFEENMAAPNLYASWLLRKRSQGRRGSEPLYYVDTLQNVFKVDFYVGHTSNLLQ